MSRLRQKCDGIVQHIESVLAAHPANGGPELVSIDMLAGHGLPFPPLWRLLVYHFILNYWKEPAMGHYCRICGRERPNEHFRGNRHKIQVCKHCWPKSERQAIEDKDDIFGFLEQSHISEKNAARLERMAMSDNPQVATLAAIVLDVARVTPHKTRRLKFLAQKHPELLGKLDAGLILAHHW
jgi:hypothetical protein